MKMRIRSTNPIKSSLEWSVLLFIPLLIICVALPQVADAVEPPPDGGYPGGNTAEGLDALFNLNGGTYNTATGLFSLRSNTTGNFNTGTGAGTLLSNTADENTAVGAGALLSNTTGIGNTANGTFALFVNTTGNGNTANGLNALTSNMTGSFNTATGSSALRSNTTGGDNTANGALALEFNNGIQNTAIGSGSLLLNAAGNNNTATGFQTLFNNTGDDNTALGHQALLGNTSGAGNTALGSNALSSSTTGNGNIALGRNAGLNVTTASNVIAIGHTGADVSNTAWISNIFGVATQSGTTAAVVVSDSGQLGTVASSERFKKDIATMGSTSEAILALRPVTFYYKSDVKEAPQFGLVAEEVAKVDPALVLRDKDGKAYSVRYDAVNAMLLNEFLKEHKAFIEERRKVQELEANAARQQKQIDLLTAGLQRVSAELEVGKLEPQIALKDR